MPKRVAQRTRPLFFATIARGSLSKLVDAANGCWPWKDCLSAMMIFASATALFALAMLQDPKPQQQQIAPSSALLSEQRPFHALHMEVLHAPVPARIDGRAFLTYELHLTSFTQRRIAVRKVDIVDGVSGAVIDSVEGVVLPRSAVVVGGEAGDALSLSAGQRAIIYLTIPWHDRASVKRLSHRVSFEADRQDSRQKITVSGAETPVEEPRLATLGAPLRGGPWAAVYAPETNGSHRRYLYAVGGQARIPGRFAIDWMPAQGFVLRSAGSSAAADGSGADVLAVAEATVVTVKEAAAPGQPPSDEDETGAMIVLDLGNGRFASYQHLMPGLRVQRGQRVRKGEVIGQLGASGHVTQPHLHFHVGTAAAPLSSEGLPYVLAAGKITGAYASIQAFEAGGPWKPVNPHPMDGLPSPNQVVVF